MIKEKYLLSALLWLSLAGCAPVVFLAGGVAGVGAYKYYQGALLVTYEAPYIETWDATLRALEKMKVKIKSQKHDLTSGRIEAELADENIVTVSLEYKTAKETDVKIRVGVFGDKQASMAIKDRIGDELFEG